MSLRASEIFEIYLSGKPLPNNTLTQCEGRFGYLLAEHAIDENNLGGVKRLIAAGLDVNWRSSEKDLSHLGHAIKRHRHEMVEYLLAAGANIVNVSSYGDHAIRIADIYRGFSEDRDETIRVLFANGAKLDMDYYNMSRNDYLFKQGVTRCRDAIVVLLGLKKRRRILGKLDRFLVSQVLAVEIWATRAQRSQTDENHVWQTWPQK